MTLLFSVSIPAKYTIGLEIGKTYTKYIGHVPSILGVYLDSSKYFKAHTKVEAASIDNR